MAPPASEIGEPPPPPALLGYEERTRRLDAAAVGDDELKYEPEKQESPVENKRKSLYGPASKAMLIYVHDGDMVPLGMG